jgi:hypothetical protein
MLSTIERVESESVSPRESEASSVDPERGMKVDTSLTMRMCVTQ